MKRLFSGGVHPDGRKELTSGEKPAILKAPPYVVIPMQQHIGAPCRPLVQVGDLVTVGQKIGDGDGMCVPVHASVSGRVVAVEPRPHSKGGNVLSVVIENDGQNTPANGISDPKGESLTRQELLSIIREAGIVGMGGAAFPTYIKADVKTGEIDTLIINGCECEPYLTADDALMRGWPEDVVKGVQLLAKVLAPKKSILAVEDNKPEAIAAVRKAAEQTDVQVRVLPARYPQGAEKQLIFAVTGREVPPGKLPKDVGCAVCNVATAAAVYRAVCTGVPAVSRIVSVTGEGVCSPGNYIVPIGTPISHVLEAAGGLTQDVQKVIAGGPMMGVALADLEAPVGKGTGSILCLKAAPAVQGTACIRCGKCLQACPMRLQPLYLYRNEACGNLQELERLHLMDCIECGCCSYVCPGKLPLVERVRAGKRALKERKTT